MKTGWIARSSSGRRSTPFPVGMSDDPSLRRSRPCWKTSEIGDRNCRQSRTKRSPCLTKPSWRCNPGFAELIISCGCVRRTFGFKFKRSFMDSTPLPENPFLPSAFHAAYNQCLNLEAVAFQVIRLDGCPPPVVCARLLGHLLRLAPAGNPQGQLQLDIASTKDHAALMQLAAFYLNCFIRVCKSHVFSSLLLLTRSDTN